MEQFVEQNLQKKRSEIVLIWFSWTIVVIHSIFAVEIDLIILRCNIKISSSKVFVV